MKKVRVEDAVGMVLGHDVTKIVPGEFKGLAFKKGHIIRKEDVDVLKLMGKNHINIVDLKEGQIHEDEAALRISRAVARFGVYFSGPSEGKIEIISGIRGITKINVEALNMINEIGELSLATIHNNVLVEEDQPVAATRAIPLVIDEARIKKVEEIARSYDNNIISVKAIRPMKIGVVISGTEVYEGRLKDRFAPVMDEKIRYYGCSHAGVKFVPDDAEMIESAIKQMIDGGADIVLTCGGMSVDADDVTPTAIKNASDSVVSYGIPALPGNMMMLAYRGKAAIFGIPAAAIFYRTTTLDLLLPRILSGERLSVKDIASYGHGGYCMKCKKCIYPVCPFGK